jgi:DNA-binding protein HU-beta
LKEKENSKMNKQELVSKVTEQVEGAKKKDVAVVVDVLFDIIKDTLAAGDSLTISKFGTFEVSERAARKGRNPQTGEEISIPASKSPKFKASNAFKEVVNV